MTKLVLDKMGNKNLTSYALIAIAAISFVLLIPLEVAFAQATPSRDEPGPQAERYQKQAEAEKEAREAKKVKPPEIKIEEEEKEKVPPEPELSFLLKEVVVTGSTIFTAEELRESYESYLGKVVTFKDLEAIAEAIKAKYKAKGYLTTNVYIPEQDISEGRVEIRILEGRLGEVRVEGNRWFSSSLIKRYFHSKKNELLNIPKIHKDLLRLNQNPDLEVGAVVSPGEEVGTTDITLKASERIPYHAGTSLDNQGTRLTGRYRKSFNLRSTNLIGLNDSFFVNTTITTSSIGDYVSYTLPVNTYGTKLGFEAVYYFMQLGKEHAPTDIVGITQVYTPHISHEILLADNYDLSVDGGFKIKSTKKFTGDANSTNEQLRMPYLDFRMSERDSFFGGGQTVFSPKFTLSLENFLGASNLENPRPSRIASNGGVLKYELELRRYQKMLFDSFLTLHCLYQNATRTLPSSEQLQLGGANSVRGYPEGDYLADTGLIFNLEWFFPLYPIPKSWKLPGADTPLRQQIQPVVFLDVGAGKIKKLVPGERENKVLVGIGGGLNIQYNRNFSFRIEWAERIGDRPTQGLGPSNFYLRFQFEI